MSTPPRTPRRHLPTWWMLGICTFLAAGGAVGGAVWWHHGGGWLSFAATMGFGLVVGIYAARQP